jgi:hypothetical protein
MGRSGWLLVLFAAGAAVAACASGGAGPSSAEVDAGPAGNVIGLGDAGAPTGGDGGLTLASETSIFTPDGSSAAVVYAHSGDTLFRLDPSTNQVAFVGFFTGGCMGVIDVALDAESNAYVTTPTDLWALDLKSVACRHIASGTYPNSLSFVPRGTLDPEAESLVGYLGSTYVRIDTTTGAITKVGSLSGDYLSSGDIVSVIGGGTFLTVKGGPSYCDDCLLQIDPKTGDLIQDYGSLNHSDVFGLAFWAGTAYGYDDSGDVFSIGWQEGALVTTDITVPNPPPTLSFWGAGSTTSAPPKSADGGGMPFQ